MGDAKEKELRPDALQTNKLNVEVYASQLLPQQEQNLQVQSQKQILVSVAQKSQEQAQKQDIDNQMDLISKNLLSSEQTKMVLNKKAQQKSIQVVHAQDKDDL